MKRYSTKSIFILVAVSLLIGLFIGVTINQSKADPLTPLYNSRGEVADLKYETFTISGVNFVVFRSGSQFQVLKMN